MRSFRGIRRETYRSFTDERLSQFQETARFELGGILALDNLAGAPAQPRPQLGVADERRDAMGQLVGIPTSREVSGLARAHEVGNAADVEPYGRRAAREALENAVGK